MGLGDWLTLATAMGTAILAIVAIIQGRQTRDQFKVSRRQAESGESASKAAIAVFQESVRARADQFAPRVIAHHGEPGGPYFSAQTLDFTQMESVLSSEAADTAASQEFVLPRDNNAFSWFYGRAVLINEGETAARIRLPSQARFISGSSPFDRSPISEPVFRQMNHFDEAVLEPGQRAMFQWADGKPASQWASGAEEFHLPNPGSSIWLWTVMFDLRASGAIDTLVLHFKPDLMRKAQNSTGIWEVKESNYGQINPLPIRRNYMSEGPPLKM